MGTCLQQSCSTSSHAAPSIWHQHAHPTLVWGFPSLAAASLNGCHQMSPTNSSETLKVPWSPPCHPTRAQHQDAAGWDLPPQLIPAADQSWALPYPLN